MTTTRIFLALLVACCCLAVGQSVKAPAAFSPDARFKADALLIIAHPDDDTTIGGYLARLADEGKRVAVIYCTSGDGGGNSVGNEAGRSLGQVRILEARRALASLGIENVWFLGASDTPGQNVLWSLDHWHHGSLLDEVVRLVRLTRPQVILTWLPDAVFGENHSDHQAAGVLATEAFDLAGDRTKFSEQVSPARDRTGMMNYTEGLLAWQPQKIYYFTDSFDNFIPYWHDPKDLSPFRKNMLDGQGPSYTTTGASRSKNKSYARIAAEELSFFGTQDGKLGVNALQSGDLKAFEFPVRFIFGKSVVGGSPTGDIFEKTSSRPVPFSPVEGYRPQPSQELSVSLGDPWLFYRQFWKAHSLDHLASLLPVPEIGVRAGGTLHIPFVIENPTPETKDVSIEPALPAGWSNKSKFDRFDVAAGDSFSHQETLVAPESGALQWQELSWKVSANGHPISTVNLRVYFGKGSALPQ